MKQNNNNNKENDWIDTVDVLLHNHVEILYTLTFIVWFSTNKNRRVDTNSMEKKENFFLQGFINEKIKHEKNIEYIAYFLIGSSSMTARKKNANSKASYQFVSLYNEMIESSFCWKYDAVLIHTRR